MRTRSSARVAQFGRSALTLLAISIVLLAHAVIRAANTNAYFAQDSPEWIYQRFLDLNGYLLKSSDVSEPERALHRRKAYEFYFEYWVRHRLPKVTHQPVVAFEQRFSPLVRREVLPFVASEDPLGIRILYVDGRCTNNAALPTIPPLKGADLASWSGYQSLVGEFRRFVGEPEPKKASQKK